MWHSKHTIKVRHTKTTRCSSANIRPPAFHRNFFSTGFPNTTTCNINATTTTRTPRGGPRAQPKMALEHEQLASLQSQTSAKNNFKGNTPSSVSKRLHEFPSVSLKKNPRQRARYLTPEPRESPAKKQLNSALKFHHKLASKISPQTRF